MANWDILGTGDGNVEDRRGAPMAVGGGLGIGGIVLLLAINYFMGGNVVDVLPQIINQAAIAPSQEVDPAQFEGADSYEIFAKTVLGSTNDTWNNIFSQLGKTYQEPTLILFRGGTESGCGGAMSQVGPHYCPTDGNIYLDETFFDELSTRLGAQGGDVAQAYVIAHEVGHHVQTQLGFTQAAKRAADSNEGSVRLELQADCFGGLWAHSIKDRGVFEPGEINEAIDAAGAVGDDNIQQRSGGYVNSDSFTHGSSAQRQYWFNRGYESGDFSQCDTFTPAQI